MFPHYRKNTMIRVCEQLEFIGATVILEILRARVFIQAVPSLLNGMSFRSPRDVFATPPMEPQSDRLLFS